MAHLLFFIAVLVAATIFALLELQIEGPDGGWAARLPTWRIRNRLTNFLCGGRPLTGYHFYVHLLVLTFCHLPFLLSFATWTLAGECRILGFILMFYIIEDFLWFVFNPAFGIRKFRRDLIWWHDKSWLWFMPRDYFIFLPLGLVFYWLSIHLA